MNSSNRLVTALIFAVAFLCCKFKQPKLEVDSETTRIHCSDEQCFGTYRGPEFVNGSDIAHQHSNIISKVVGDKLKSLFDDGKYSKVDFVNIKMSTEGMGTGNVEYELTIPFLRVDNKCDAYTSFDHVGGWNHKPALERRKRELQKALIKGDSLFISNLKVTKEGLEEYWIQWKNKLKQSECVSQ